MAQSKEFVDASHALNDLSHALALLESENASLRGAVDGLCNENAKLRDELDAAKHDLSLFSERIVELGAENAKLRELAAGIGYLLFKLDVDYCATCPRDDINHPCPVYTVDGGECLYKTDMRELGVEVDG